MGYNNLKQQLSTGNTLQDILLAGGIGFAQNFNPKDGTIHNLIGKEMV